MNRFLGIIIMVFTMTVTAKTLAQEAAPGWLSPVISYGKVMPMSDGAVPLNPKHSYKLIFDISDGGSTPGKLLPGAVRAARFLNLAALAGVPDENVQLAIMLHGPATFSVLRQAQFSERFQVPNQNLTLFSELRKAGVEIYVCGQALGHLNLQADWVAADVDVSVSALTTVAEYQLRGYHVMR